MRLSTRIAIAMASLVVLTAAAVGALSYRNIESGVLPRALDRLDLEATLMAEVLAAEVHGGAGDVLGVRSGAPEAITRAILAGGINPIDGVPLSLWIDRLERRWVADMASKPIYARMRMIGIADNGREIVRVERTAAGAPTRVVPAMELQQFGDRSYFQETLKLPDGRLYISPVELTRDGNRMPVLRAATPIYGPDARPFGIVLIDMDLKPVFERIRVLSKVGQVFVVNAQGDYLVHPDRSREFGFASGRPFKLQDDFPQLAALPTNASSGIVTRDRQGASFGIGAQTQALAGGPAVTVVRALPFRTILTTTYTVRDSTLLAGASAVLLALAVAAILARSLTRPLTRMTAAMEEFGRSGRVVVPAKASGELGQLARTFERMSAEVAEKTETILRNAEVFESIMSGMADDVLLFDDEFRVVYANPAARLHMGPRAEPGQNDWVRVFAPHRADGITPLPKSEWPVIKVMRGESVDDFEMTIVLPGQATPRSLVVSGRPIRMQADGRMGAVLVRRDVTDMRATERQLHESQKLEAVGKLTGGVAHDFNNMLTVIISNAESLADELRGNPGLLDLVKAIDMAADRGADLTRQLLAFARRQPLLPRETNINDLVVASAKLLTPTLGEHIEIESMLDDEAWPALIDPTQLSTALVNLGVNARDAMPEGGKLTFETRNVVLDESYTKTNPDAKPGSYVLVAVSDTGSGIPEAIRDKVLEPFFTTKEIGKGTGLGLSMVYGFVKQSNGHIKIYSEIGHGTSVKLYLPRNTGAAEPAGSAAPTPVPLGSETILVVEDDEAVRGSVIAQLHSLGYSTLSAADGAEALALVDSGAPFDLVFTDVIMPGGINGRQLSEAIAQRIPGVKVLYTSGYTENAIVHHGRLDPGVALLNKPYRKADLARKVREVLDA